jgi:Predicted nucleoside-diphosphate sugar epimerase
MKLILAGATGQIGRMLLRDLAGERDASHELIMLTRATKSLPAETRLPGVRVITWDARSLGPWADEIDGADAVINLAGRSVNCRYTKTNLAEMLSSRVESTRVIGEAIARAKQPPRVWLQMSTATIYAHRFDAPNDDMTGILGGSEPDAPRYWDKSIEIARAWEETLFASPTPRTRKVALRAAMVMSPDRSGVFDTLARLAQRGLGGAHGSGRQYVSWIHEYDFVAAIRFLLAHEELSGPVNLSSPEPLTNHAFQQILRHALLAPFGLRSPEWLLKIGAFFLRTDVELLLKSRRVIPRRLLEAGFRFRYPDWPSAAIALASRRAVSK